jgi:uncharacterized protein YxeA
MKRIVGSLTAVMLALGLGVATYANATPRQSSGTKQATSAPKASTTHKHKKSKKKHKHTKPPSHHKMTKSGNAKGQEKMKKSTTPKP